MLSSELGLNVGFKELRLESRALKKVSHFFLTKKVAYSPEKLSSFPAKKEPFTFAHLGVYQGNTNCYFNSVR